MTRSGPRRAAFVPPLLVLVAAALVGHGAAQVPAAAETPAPAAVASSR